CQPATVDPAACATGGPGCALDGPPPPDDEDDGGIDAALFDATGPRDAAGDARADARGRGDAGDGATSAGCVACGNDCCALDAFCCFRTEATPGGPACSAIPTNCIGGFATCDGPADCAAVGGTKSCCAINPSGSMGVTCSFAACPGAT